MPSLTFTTEEREPESSDQGGDEEGGRVWTRPTIQFDPDEADR